MKKTISLLLAALVICCTVCAFGISAFAKADPEATEAPTQPATLIPATTVAPTAAPTAAPTEAPTAAPTTVAATEPVIHTLAEGQTVVDDGDEPATVVVPKNVDSGIPNTGSTSSIAVVALLALAGATAVALKSKKNED